MITPRKRDDDDDDDASTGTLVSSDGEPGRQRNLAKEVEEAVERKTLMMCLSTFCCGFGLLVAALVCAKATEAETVKALCEVGVGVGVFVVLLALVLWATAFPCLEICRLQEERHEYAKAAQSGDTEFHQFRKEQQEYEKAAAAQTTKLVEMVERLAKRQEKEGLKQESRWKTLACWFVLWCAAVLLARAFIPNPNPFLGDMEIRRLHKELQDYAKAQSGDTELRQFRKEQQEYAKAAAAQTTKLVEMMEGLAKRQEKECLKQESRWKTLACWFVVWCVAVLLARQDYAKAAAAQTTKLVEMVEGLAKRQEKEGLKQKSRWKTLACWFVLWCAAVLLARQEYAKAAAAQTTKLVEMMEGLEKWKEGLKQPKNNQETLNDLVVQSTENPKDEGQEETEESDWVKFFFEKRFEWKFNDWVHEKKVRKDFFKYIMEKMEEVVERHRLQQRESAVLQKQGTLDEYWLQREALMFLAKGLWRMKFEELGKLHKHYDEKRRAVRDKFESTKWYGHEQVQATLKKQFEDRSKKLNTSTRIFKLRLILRRSTCRSDIRAVRLSCSTSSST